MQVLTLQTKPAKSTPVSPLGWSTISNVCHNTVRTG